MTDSTENPNPTPTPEQAEIASLRAHNADLLRDLKAAKAETKAAQDAIAGLTSERDAARTEYRRAALDVPVGHLIDRIAVEGMAAPLRREFERFYDFALDDNGQVQVRCKDGTPARLRDPDSEEKRGGVMVKVRGAERDAAFTTADIERLAMTSESGKLFAAMIIGTRASGGGSTGAGAGAASSPTHPATPAKTVPQPFGLR